MKKRILVVGVMALVLVMLCVGSTYALLLSKSLSVTNTFVSGDIGLTLTETTGSKYTMVPGCEIYKNPRITVKGGSVECWLFFKAESRDDFDSFVSCYASDGWTLLTGESQVWWRRVEKSNTDKVFPIIKGDTLTVSENVTEEKLESLKGDLKLTFSAYAVQYEGVSTPEKAWDIIIKEMEEEI